LRLDSNPRTNGAGSDRRLLFPGQLTGRRGPGLDNQSDHHAALVYFAYLVGLSVLNLPAAAFSLDAVLSGDILLPFLTGCLLIGIVCATVGYFGIDYFWRYYAANKWASRKQKRKNAPTKKNPFRAIQ